MGAADTRAQPLAPRCSPLRVADGLQQFALACLRACVRRAGCRWCACVPLVARGWCAELAASGSRPDIPHVATVKEDQLFRVETIDWTGGQIKDDDNSDDIKFVDLRSDLCARGWLFPSGCPVILWIVCLESSVIDDRACACGPAARCTICRVPSGAKMRQASPPCRATC